MLKDIFASLFILRVYFLLSLMYVVCKNFGLNIFHFNDSAIFGLLKNFKLNDIMKTKTRLKLKQEPPPPPHTTQQKPLAFYFLFYFWVYEWLKHFFSLFVLVSIIYFSCLIHVSRFNITHVCALWTIYSQKSPREWTFL